MFTLIQSWIVWSLATFADIATLPIKVYVIPALNVNGLLNPFLDAAEINIVATVILLSMLGTLTFINALLSPVARFFKKRAIKNAKDNSSTKGEENTNTAASQKAAQSKPALPFKRVRVHQNKEQKKQNK